MRLLRIRLAFAIFAVGFVCVSARADLSPLLERCPPNTNAIVAVDSSHLMSGPLAARLGWIVAGAAGSGRAPRVDSPLAFVGLADEMVLAMQWDVGQMEPAWELMVLDSARGGPSVDNLAATNGGYVDAVAGKPAAWFSNDTGVVRLDERTLGLFRPADRQLVARWVRKSSAGREAGVSDYLRGAAARAGEATPVVVAIDLTEAFGEAGVRRAIERGQIAALGGAPGTSAEWAKLLAGTRGATLSLTASDPPRARLAVDFSGKAARLAGAAKPLVLEAMSRSGLTFPDMQQWTFRVSDQVVSAEGTMSDDGVARLFSLLETSMRQDAEPPAAAQTAADKGAAAGTPAAPAASPQASPAAASQRYFKAVSAILDRLKPGASLGDSAAWLARDARRIDQLPTANVDPDLLAWAGDVSAKLRESSSVLYAGQQRVRAASASAQVPAAYAQTGTYADRQQAAQARADLENSRRQARQASADERARATTDAAKPLQEALDSRGKIRAELTRKYGTDF